MDIPEDVRTKENVPCSMHPRAYTEKSQEAYQSGYNLSPTRLQGRTTSQCHRSRHMAGYGRSQANNQVQRVTMHIAPVGPSSQVVAHNRFWCCEASNDEYAVLTYSEYCTEPLAFLDTSILQAVGLYQITFGKECSWPTCT